MPKFKTSKEELIEQCFSVFKSIGYPAASVSILASACNVEKAHLYYYFKNKEDIMLEVLKYLQERLNNDILNITYNEDLPYSERLSTLLSKLKSFYKEVKIGCLMTNTVIQTLYESDEFSQVAKTTIANLTNAIAYLYQDRYSITYAKGKAQQAVQDMYGGLIFSQIYKDESYLDKAIERIQKKL